MHSKKKLQQVTSLSDPDLQEGSHGRISPPRWIRH